MLEWADRVLADEGVRDTTGLSGCRGGPRATARWTFSVAFCRKLTAC